MYHLGHISRSTECRMWEGTPLYTAPNSSEVLSPPSSHRDMHKLDLTKWDQNPLHWKNIQRSLEKKRWVRTGAQIQGPEGLSGVRGNWLQLCDPIIHTYLKVNDWKLLDDWIQLNVRQGFPILVDWAALKGRELDGACRAWEKAMIMVVRTPTGWVHFAWQIFYKQFISVTTHEADITMSNLQ